MKKQDLTTSNLPDSSGVYFFKDKEGNILYIGKATSLKNRVKSYFDKDIIEKRGLRIKTMVTASESVSFRETDSVLEALLLESKLIKENNPPYNAKEKDNKSFSCVVITKEDYPRVLVMRIRDFEKKFSKKEVSYVFGPFASLSTLKEAVKIIRKIFPFRDSCDIGQKRKCFNAQIGLCPGVCVGDISKEEYKRQIINIAKFFDGGKSEIKRTLELEMNDYSKKELFEKAKIVRNRIFAIDHIKDISLIKDEDIVSFKNKSFRIEAYDVAHISGTNRVGVMTVIKDKEKDKSEYRKFKLEENINDDYGGIRELLKRRLNHKNWEFPDLIVLDGGENQRKVGEKIVTEMGLLIPCVSVVKNDKHKPKDILGNKKVVDYHKKEILLANQEAHRFAINYHKVLRNKIN